MPVNITNEELDLFNKNGFSDDDVRETINSYRSQGLDDKAIRNKIDQRLNSWQPKQETPVLQGGISEWFNPQALDEKFKKANQKALEARQEWEEKHPIISGIQKDYQPGYRAAVPRWEQGAKYGMNAPLAEQAKTGLKQFGLNLVPATNITVDALTGGSGAVAKQGAKQAIIQGAKVGAKTGAIGGATQGLTSSVADNGLTKDALIRPLQYGAAGLVLGAPLGAAGGVIGNVGRSTTPKNITPTPSSVAKKSVQSAEKEAATNSELLNPEINNNLFGGEVEKVEGLVPETKQSKLTQTMADKGTLPEEFKNITPEYQVLHNADIANQATEAIKENPNKVLGELQQKVLNKDSELSALDFETARQTVSKLYQEGRTEEALALTEQISQKASKAGQSVQALSLWSKTTPEGAVRYAQKIISDYNKKAKKKIPLLSEQQAKEIMELAQNTQSSEIGTRENDIANQLLLKYFKELVPANVGSKIRTLQNISLLLNPKTFARNIGGNSIFAAMDTGVAKPIAAGIDKIASKFTGQRTRVLPQLKEYTQGLGQGFREGVEDVKLGINTRDKLGSRFNLNDRNSFDNVPGLKQLEKALNYSLQVPDRMFYQAAYNESIANQLRAAGAKEATPEMIKNATNDALEAVFQNNSALGNMALKLRQAGNQLINVNGYGLGDAFVPYAQTPANVAQQGINYSPLGLVKGIKNFANGNQRQATMDIARGITGSGLMGLGALGAYKGIINPYIDDYEVQKNYEAMGIKPGTINIGDYNVSYNQLQPLAAPVAGGAAIVDIKNGDYMQALDKSLGSVIDLGMLQTANKFMADLNDQDKGIGTATTNLISSIPSRFVPTGLKQINDLIDNTQRETYDPNPLKQGLNQAIAKVPGLSSTLPVKYDITGQPMQKYQTEGIQRVFDTVANPVFVNKKKDDPTIQKLIDLYETTGDKSVLLPMADKTVRFKDLKGNQVVKRLDAKQKNEYQQQWGVLNKQLLDDIVKTDFFNNLDDLDKVNLVNATTKYNKSIVDEKMFNKPSIQKRNLIKKYTQTEKEKAMQEIMKIYKEQILPAKANQIYQENFG